jgi:hypothetical protein
MTKLMIFMGLFFSLQLLAQDHRDDEVQVVDVSEDGEITYSIKEIKTYVKTLESSSTCLDDYLKRRKNIIIKLSASPFMLAAAVPASALAGVAVGSVTYSLLYNILGLLRDPTGGWEKLIYIIFGGGVSGIAGGVYVLADSGISVVRLIDTQRLLKATMEAHQGRIGVSTHFLFEKFKARYPHSSLSVGDFSSYLLQSDRDGTLCDGSKNRMKRRWPFKNSLRYKLARSQDIFFFLNE